MNLQNVLMEGEEIVIDDATCFNAIGPGVTLKNCTLKCGVPAKSLGVRGTLIQSTVVAEQKLVGFSWLEATLDCCEFFGSFRENHFGTKGPSGKGRAVACSFTNADLDDCLFFGTGSDCHVFPGWPNFTILNPSQHLLEMRQMADKDEIIADIVCSIEFFDEQLGALSYSAEVLAGELHVMVDAVKASLERLSFVLM